ncbi:MAG: 16S rRNA (cytosine(967)-C(5))-methyltransferase RsmB [Nitrospiraceae bacterium]|nr:16S rRNA (cytosine(967)-C(5))-methyltransferase RsmB [Nitrospiraceae bacterium]
MSAADARAHALEALGLIGRGNVQPKEALFPAGGSALPRRERALLMELVYGVLRQKDLLDYLISGFLKKPGMPARGRSVRTADNLRLAAYQIFFTRIPARAAVNEAVNLEKAFAFRGGKPSLVNAVLRNIIRNKRALDERLSALEAEAKNPATGAERRTMAISTLTSHPVWLIRRWAGRLGAAGALDLALAGNRVPPLVLRVNTLRKTREEVLQILALKGIRAEPTRFSPAGIKIIGPEEGAAALAGRARTSFREMEFLHPFCTAQDEAAQLAAYLLAPLPGEKVLDACAAPGGKTTHIAELMKGLGQVVAVDIDPGRLERLKENLSRLGLGQRQGSVSVLQGDITDEGGAVYGMPGRFDRVLLDAPCSSLGVIRRNPDVKYRHGEKDLAGFAARQLRMLAACSKALKKGGTLLYSTCSTEPEEGEMVTGDFLAAMKGCFAIDEEVPPALLPLMKNGFLRTYPHREDMDGFFMAKLRKLC